MTIQSICRPITGKRKHVILSLLLLCIIVNSLLTWMVGSKLGSLPVQSPAREAMILGQHQEPEQKTPKRKNPHRKTMPPQESSQSTAGFIHIGKTGGSTISKLLRNGCTSFVAGPCRNITNESIVSKKVEHYYHVPDFHRLPTSNHGSFIISVRDVYERTVSSFLYHHPKNAAVNHVQLNKAHEEYGPLAYRCFDTLDEYAALIRGIQNPADCNYPYRHNVVDIEDCAALACATLHGKVRFFVHLFFNFRNILYTKLPINDGNNPPRQLYAIRQEFLWKDWEELNIMWGQTTTPTTTANESPVYIPPADFNQRNISGLELPVTRAMSPEGRRLLCTALEAEYLAYFRILRMSNNMDEDDFESSLKIAEKSCPNLDFQGMVQQLRQ